MSASSPDRKLRWYEYAVALLPFTLAFTGALGLAIGPAACALNLVVMGSKLRLLTKMLIAVSLTILAVVLWVLMCLLLR